MFAISNAHELKKEPINNGDNLAKKLIFEIDRFELLIISLFLHDIAKGLKGDHSINGAKIAKNLCHRLGLNKSDTEIVSWCVLNHLFLSETAFRYDLNDKKIIEKSENLVNYFSDVESNQYNYRLNFTNKESLEKFRDKLCSKKKRRCRCSLFRYKKIQKNY